MATQLASAQQGVFFQPARKRFQDVGLHTPIVSILPTGMIKELSPGARVLLEIEPSGPFEPSFFSLVHSKNQYQVMRDVADMILHGKHAATWFLRLRTGRKRWQWLRAHAVNALSTPDGVIRVKLSEATPQW